MAARQETGPDFSTQASVPDVLISPKEQMGLLGGREMIIAPELSLGQLPQEPRVEARDMSGRIKQGEFNRVFLANLNTIVQQRQVYKGINTLAGNISEVGLIHPLLVSRYTTPEAAQEYLSAVYNSIGRRIPPENKTRLQNLKVTVDEQGREVYDIVVSGHRRLRALNKLEAKDIVLQVIEDIDPYVALKMQASENTYKPPDDWERAMGNGDLYTVESAFNPRLTYKIFAKKVGVTEDAFRRDLRFYGLPDKVREYVIPRLIVDDGGGDSEVAEQPLMPFNIACQLGRLVEAGASDHDILLLARNLFVSNITDEKEASRRVTNYIRDSIKHKNESLFNIFGENAAVVSRRRRTREVARQDAPKFREATGYIRRVKRAKEMDLPDGGEQNISFAGAANDIRNFAHEITELLPFLRDEFSDPDEVARIRKVYEELREWAEETIEVVGPENLEERNLLGQISSERHENGNGKANLSGEEVVLFQADGPTKSLF